VQYWKRQLEGAPPSLELPTDRPHPPVQSFKGAVSPFALSAELSRGLQDLASRCGATLYMVLLAAFQVLLSRWSGQKDIVVGSPIAGRTHRETEGLIGLFVNTLVMRSDLSGNPTFTELLAQTKETTLGAYEHQDIPFEKLVDEMQPARDLSRQPIYQVNFTFQNLPAESLLVPVERGLRTRFLGVGHVTAKVDLGLYVQEAGSGLQGALEYATDLFDRPTIEGLAGSFRTLLAGIMAHPEQRVAALPLLSHVERHRLLVEWNATESQSANAGIVCDLIAEQVARAPHAAALEFGGKTLTYAELDSRSNQLAHYLQSVGVGPDVIVGFCVERSLEMVVGLLGIWKAGGAYLPIDRQSPPERLAFMLDDARVAVLLTQQALEESLPTHWARVVSLDGDAERIARCPMSSPSSAATPDNCAYVIFTSGSSGQPKGVVVSHRGLRNLAEAQRRGFGVEPHSRVLQFARLSFDASVSEIVMSLTAGATLCLTQPSWSAARDLAQALKERRISTVTLPPSALAMLEGQEFPALQTLVVAGEACAAMQAACWASRCRFINAYGPTETTVCASFGQWDGADSVVSIGRALSNTQLYVLDEVLEPVPAGVVGELYIGGIGLARGYSNRPGMTAECFIAHPFADGQRLYRTGDLVRYRADGSLVFVGRCDTQVKLRGYRVELGEVEAALLMQESVKQALVVLREDAPGEERLVGYVVSECSAPETSELRLKLRERLPDYMVPSAIVVLEALPLTPNGKVDRAALPAPEGRPEIEEYFEPRSPTEEILVGIWREVLRLDRVGIHDDFF